MFTFPSFDDLIGHLQPSTELTAFAGNLADSFWDAVDAGTLGLGGVFQAMCSVPDAITSAFYYSYRWMFLIFGIDCPC
jgi:hypothetical protein